MNGFCEICENLHNRDVCSWCLITAHNGSSVDGKPPTNFKPRKLTEKEMDKAEKKIYVIQNGDDGSTKTIKITPEQARAIEKFIDHANLENDYYIVPVEDKIEEW